jgi:hypothetical protein
MKGYLITLALVVVGVMIAKRVETALAKKTA